MRLPRTRSVVGAAIAFGASALAWEMFARSGSLPPAITPPVEAIAAALGRMIADGTMFVHVGYTLARIGVARARHAGGRAARHADGPLQARRALRAAAGQRAQPDPVAGVGAAVHPLVRPRQDGQRRALWIRAAESMGAGSGAIFRHVVLPGALPFVIAGLRQAFARGWIAVVGGEMIAATRWGLGWVIFDSKEFLNTDVMLGSLAVIGLLGLGVERLVFAALERRTVERWGLMRSTRA